MDEYQVAIPDRADGSPAGALFCGGGWMKDPEFVDWDASALAFSSRVSDSAWIASVWTARSEHVDEMTAVASESWGLVLWTQDGAQQVAVVGPETRTGTAPVPRGASFVWTVPASVDTPTRWLQFLSTGD